MYVRSKNVPIHPRLQHPNFTLLNDLTSGYLRIDIGRCHSGVLYTFLKSIGITHYHLAFGFL